MAITASDVAKLRKMTGAGMMDCKKALEEANGDFERAQDLIRERGKLIASKRADREATEGAVLAKTTADGKRGAIICLNCETDFVAKNADFVGLADNILNLAVEKNPASLEELLSLELEGLKIGDLVTEKSGVTGEKLTLSFYGKLEDAFVIPYIHMNNKLATLVSFSKQISEDVAKDVAMQVAAMKPVALDKTSTPAEVVEKELQIAKEQLRLEGKSEDMIEKIAPGKLNKFFKENTLMAQDFIKDSKISVEAYVKAADADAKVTGFVRYSLND